MMNNSLYENLLLTGIVARLAVYPQPILRSFLLNTHMVFHPNVKSLYQVFVLCWIDVRLNMLNFDKTKIQSPRMLTFCLLIFCFTTLQLGKISETSKKLRIASAIFRFDVIGCLKSNSPWTPNVLDLTCIQFRATENVTALYLG